MEVRGWLLTSPYLLYSLVFFLIPLGWSLWLVFTNWNLISPRIDFIGLENFVKAFKSARVHAAFLSAYRIMGFFLPMVLVQSLAVALLINSLPWGRAFFSVGFFMPYLASGVAVALVVRGILAYNSPAAPIFKALFGTIPNWFGHPVLAVFIISLLIAWKFSGYYALIFLAGLQSIPKELYEAAELDGARFFTKLFRITLPMLYPAFYTVLIMAVGLCFAIFTEPFMLTGGGPGRATHTWYLEIYYQVFQNLRAGYGAAISFINAAITFTSVLIVRRLMQRWGRALGYE
jgi:multiple sugar transport system permease protein